MMTPEQFQVSARVAAATLIYEAKIKEHEAACLMRQGVEEARNAVVAAVEAMVDAKQELYRTFDKQL